MLEVSIASLQHCLADDRAHDDPDAEPVAAVVDPTAGIVP
jgi:hypothetical protein